MIKHRKEEYMKPQLKAIYLSVTDMNRAVNFYETIFDKKCSSKEERMSSFVFGNFYFLLFDPSQDGENAVFGNNAVPNIEVEDINEMIHLAESKGLEIVRPLWEVDKLLIFQMKDTEGNIIEFYQMQK
jgi:predicted enzyme related to lactoylglutathione lyase